MLEKIPADGETWEKDYKDYAKAEAADFIELLEGRSDPPRNETDDMTLEEKRDLAKADYLKRSNYSFTIFLRVLKSIQVINTRAQSV